jgi:hypothetical protein
MPENPHETIIDDQVGADRQYALVGRAELLRLVSDAPARPWKSALGSKSLDRCASVIHFLE